MINEVAEALTTNRNRNRNRKRRELYLYGYASEKASIIQWAVYVSSYDQIMAKTFCNLGTGSGLTKLNGYHISNRPYRGFATLSCLSCNAQKVFLGRELKIRRQWQHCGQAFVSNRSSYCSNNTIHQEEDKEADISKPTLIWLIKLPIYSVALIPLTVGSAAAYLQTGMFSSWRYSILLVSSVLIITWPNLSNDVYDFDTGADVNKKESVVNLVGSRTGTLVSAYLLLALGFLGLAWVSVKAGNTRAILLFGCAVIFEYNALKT